MPSERWNHDEVVQAEIAIEILTKARAMLSERVYAIEATDPAQAEILRDKRAELTQLSRAMDFQGVAAVQAIIASWGPLVKDEEAFWRAVGG
jgi:hypothetical protein